jgi:hypothetical protein
MVWCAVEQCVSLYKLYVKCCSTRKWQGTYCHKFSWKTVPRTRGIHKLIKKVGSTGSLVDKKPARKCHVLIKEILVKMGTRLEHTTEVTETLCTRDQHLEINL